MLKLYRELVKLRGTRAFQSGFFKFSITNDQVLSFFRFRVRQLSPALFFVFLLF